MRPIVASLAALVPSSATLLAKRERERLATRRLLSALLGEEIEVEHTPDGAPFIVGKPYHLSISHTETHVAVFLGDAAHSLGVDIEPWREKLIHTAPRFLHLEELAALSSLTREEQYHFIWAAWCSKEALYKAKRNGSPDFRRNYRFSLRPVPTISYLENGIIQDYPVELWQGNTYMLATVSLTL